MERQTFTYWFGIQYRFDYMATYGVKYEAESLEEATEMCRRDYPEERWDIQVVSMASTMKGEKK